MSEWVTKPLGEILTQHKPEPVTPSAEDLVLFAGVRWYGAGLFVREERPGSEVIGKCFPLKPGALVYNRLFAWKQAFAVVGEEYAGVVVSNEFPQFDVDTAQATPEFVALYCSSPRFADLARALSTGAAAVSRNRLKEIDLLTLPIKLPPVEQQKTITDLMSRVVAAYEAAVQEKHALVRVLRLRRAQLIAGVDTEPVRADEAFEIRLGRQRSPERANGPSMTPYLRSANVGYDELRMDDVLSMDFTPVERERYQLKDGDVLVSEGSASPTAIGIPAVWHDELEGPVCIQNTLLRFRAVDGVTTPAFVRHWCLWAFEAGEFRDAAGEAPGVRHIGFKRASAMRVRLPDLDRQSEIAAILGPMSDAAASLRNEAERLLALRGALLDSLLAGEIDLAEQL
ncbi:restriction endonuclease subunit S [Dietzia cinnamea]|uniref:restriction endonuclease subunit S n=1 Tax=Dietzia cinnamea TaxID=321318 RepID=UPI0021A28B18|nr:restriction endonuclease subunit S [Dietzia cinnamea]MCT1886908.1 restriction endonuclease subunit S [Dietzia cinnamea]